MSVNADCTEDKYDENSGKNEKAGAGGEVSECGKYRQIPPHHPAFLFKTQTSHINFSYAP